MNQIIELVSRSVSRLRNQSRPGRFAHLWDRDISSAGLLGFDDSPHRKHQRSLSISRWTPRRIGYLFTLLAFIVFCLLFTRPAHDEPKVDPDLAHLDANGKILLGHSIWPGGNERFWWQDFNPYKGFFQGRNNVVPMYEYIPEQEGTDAIFDQMPGKRPPLVPMNVDSPADAVQCYLDEAEKTPIPTISGYEGLPQGMTSPILGSHKVIGLHDGFCYDRINRLAPYGFGFAPGDLQPVPGTKPDNEGIVSIPQHDWGNIGLGDAQARCVKKNAHRDRSRTAVIIRTWDSNEYTELQKMTLRAMINELTLASSGDYEVHFLIHVRNESLPIWASDDIYNDVLRASLPEEFWGMGTLWSVAQMRLLYPPPFPPSIENFSGSELYEAYRSLHFPLQYFAYEHPEFDYFWQWEMDMRVTGHYYELLQTISDWAESQVKDHLWESSAKYYIPSLFNNSYKAYVDFVKEETRKSGAQVIAGPQLASSRLFPVPPQSPNSHTSDITDLITLNPLFNPEKTAWAFHNDITGYPLDDRPPTRAALIAASRLSRRLLLLMHEETYSHKHTMFPEMYPASIALHYGLKAVYAPLPVYFEHDWQHSPGNGPTHIDEVFNNARLTPESIRLGMIDHGSGYYHGEGGSIFGPGEHPFRSSSYYSNAFFAGYLWRRWLGRENSRGEIDYETTSGKGRMCLPMMVLHTVKNE